MRVEDNNKMNSSFSKDYFSKKKAVKLLEERLIVDKEKSKAGEVVIRKVIKTRIVEVPVRREVLIVEKEQPGEENKFLTEIDLTEDEINQNLGFNSSKSDTTEEKYSIAGEFVSLERAKEIIEIFSEQSNEDIKVKLEFIAPDSQLPIK